MKVGYIHFHLKTGGVTTVLTQQVNAIRRDAEVLVLSGTPPQTSLPADAVVVDGLGYDSETSGRKEPEAVAESILRAVYRKWKAGCDLIHVHNATLAKNRNLLKILHLLQQRGCKLFIQIHDFAEDGRPSVYFEDDYPRDCHYGVINSRDYRVLLRSGLKVNGLHKLFNMIQLSTIKPAAPSDGGLVLYPVRALRRKNIGEAILLSLFFPDDHELVITLPPNSPMDLKSYEGWKAYVLQENLRVRFDAGIGADFNKLVESAEEMITTSVKEGFGFSYLEPWSAAKFLWGRKLPEICRDFEEKGISLNHMYVRLNVPLEWIGKDNLLKRLFACVVANSDRFHFKIDQARTLQAIEQSISADSVDFGILDERFQKVVLSRLITCAGDKNRLIACNPWLSSLNAFADRTGLIARNQGVVRETYSEHHYRQTLLQIYQRVIHTPVRHHIDKNVLISQFFDPTALSLLTWGDYVE
ncbi:MAG: glycosyltransferase [Thermodesulfobacteriota bacterium]